MRGKKAKTIRKLIYGDQSQRQERRYTVERLSSWFMNRPITLTTVRNAPDSLRAIYQRAKANYKKAKANGNAS